MSDEETGLIYANARYQDPKTSRWISSDPAMADGLNWYSYVNNNPIKYKDPTGRTLVIDNGMTQEGMDDNDRMLAEINSLSETQYQFVLNTNTRKLSLAVDEKATEAMKKKIASGEEKRSSTYSSDINKLIESEDTFTARYATDEQEQFLANDGGGRVESPSPGQVDITISKNGSTNDPDNPLTYVGGGEVKASSAEVLMHEIIAHAAPRATITNAYYAGSIYLGDVLTDMYSNDNSRIRENIARREAGLRPIDESSAHQSIILKGK
ncbi:RHS repeat-associated core domain-containing protein [Entomospira entomophila]|uniref:RHS repeat-associated core domain-containing protein n=1 Tax=Entomospira entomophila TaxID=2719988 RepID=A0A968KWQ4_9SPIO|nr:RHS repeat-associated core domain-containing protein [Entomospira entomophilus]NIZ41040.1 RHS repeat-associated core domain-containing protein [Entomospira entomophilus]WDI36154.1 RHS repeat-associated core domain-containing protein [Entomospira entomophilus]